MATDPKPDFRFDYSKWQSSGVPMEHVEDIRKVAIQPATNIFTQVFLLVRVLILVGCEWLRMRKMNEEMLKQKQDYERGRNQEQRGDIAQDDLD